MLSPCRTEAADVVRVRVNGKLCSHAPQIAHYLSQTRYRMPDMKVVLDLSEAEIHSRLLPGMFLVQSCHEFRIEEGRLAFCFSPHQAWFVAEMTKFGLDQAETFGEVFFDPAEAVRSLSASS